MSAGLNRRAVLRGTLNGAAITVALPLLDCFLTANGNALASGGPVPVRFGTWFWGCGMTPERWVPSKDGADYDLPAELKPFEGIRDRLNILSGFNVPLD